MAAKSASKRRGSAHASDADPDLGELLRSARTHHRLTLREVEERTGIPNPHLSQIERGLIRRPDQQIIWKLSQLYELDFGLLSEWIGNRSGDSEAESIYFATALRLLNELSEPDLEEAAQYLEALSRRRQHEGNIPD